MDNEFIQSMLAALRILGQKSKKTLEKYADELQELDSQLYSLLEDIEEEEKQ